MNEVKSDCQLMPQSAKDIDVSCSVDNQKSISNNVFSVKKVKCLDLIGSFKNRVKWRVFRDTIAVSEYIPKARGYDELIEKISNLENSLSTVLALNAILALENSLVESLVFGEKSIRFLKVEQQIACDIRNFVRGEVSKYDSSSIIKSLNVDGCDYEHKLISVYEDGKGCYLAYTLKRSEKIKESVSRSMLRDDYKGNISRISKMYIERFEEKQCFDIIHIPNDKNVIELRVDISTLSKAEERQEASINLISEFRRYIRKGCDKIVNGGYINFFPSISRLLALPVGNGRVVELDFVTNEGAVKNHKNRRVDGCILVDEYHLAGAEKINGQFTPYRISRVWDVKSEGHKSKPELFFPGNMRMVSVPTPVLQEAIISGVATKKDYLMIMGKLQALID